MTDTHLVWDTFLIRIWRESPGRAWRGQITHLPTQASAHFATFAQAEAFIRRFAPEVDPVSAAGQLVEETHSSDT